MYKRNFILVTGIITSLLIMGAGCSLGPSSDSMEKDMPKPITSTPVKTPTSTAVKKPTPKPVSKTIYVTITAASFQPAAVDVKPGMTVVWTNKSKEEHTVTAYDGSFDSGPIPPGGTYKHTFTRPVSYSYYCKFHNSMQGTIIAPR